MDYRSFSDSAWIASVLSALLLVWVFPASASASSNAPLAGTVVSTSEVSERSARAADAFGIDRQKYTVDEFRIRRNQTFADLLLNQGVPYQEIVTLAKTTRDVFDVRDIQAGRSYRVYRNPWLNRARYLVYRPNAVEYVVFDVRYPESFTDWRTACVACLENRRRNDHVIAL